MLLVILERSGTMKKLYAVIISILLIIIAIMLIFLLRSCNTSVPPNDETPPPTLDFKEYEAYKNESISIPGTTGLNFKSEQLSQTVDFYNPKNNPCYFVISLYLSDNTLIYKSDYLSPGEHINEITLNQKLKRGLYSNCRLLYECYTLENKSKLNSGDVKLEINSK